MRVINDANPAVLTIDLNGLNLDRRTVMRAVASLVSVSRKSTDTLLASRSAEPEN